MSIADGNATAETGEFCLACGTRCVSLQICVLGARVQLARSSMEISCPCPTHLLLRVLCHIQRNLQSRVLAACDMSAICCSVSIGCSNNLSMQSASLPLSLSACAYLFRALHDGSSPACRMKQSTFVDATSTSALLLLLLLLLLACSQDYFCVPRVI